MNKLHPVWAYTSRHSSTNSDKSLPPHNDCSHLHKLTSIDNIQISFASRSLTQTKKIAGLFTRSYERSPDIAQLPTSKKNFPVQPTFRHLKPSDRYAAYNSEQVRKHSSPSYTEAGRHQQPLDFRTTVKQTHTGEVQSTPKKDSSSAKPKKLAQLRSKILNSISEARSVESKFYGSTADRNRIEESEIVFKGSRDISNLKPLRLMYEDELDTKLQPDFNIIRKDSLASMLIRQTSPLGLILSAIQMHSSFNILHDLGDRCFIEVYWIHSQGYPSLKYLITQPYEYSLQELIQMRRVNQQNVDSICKHFDRPVNLLIEKGHYGNIDIKGLVNHTYYIHGCFKVLPVISQSRLRPLSSAKDKSMGIVASLREELVSRSRKAKGI